MFNQGLHVLWQHIHDFFQDDSSSSLRLLQKLTPDHIFLTSYTKTYTKGLLEYSRVESHETARFCLMVDQFYDCGNARNSYVLGNVNHF